MKKKTILFLISIFILILLTSYSYMNMKDSKVNKLASAFIQGKCVETIPGHNNIGRLTLNVVFIGIEVNNIEANLNKESFDLNYLEKRSKKLTENIFSIEPYKSNGELINFWNYSDILQKELIFDEKTNTARLPYEFNDWSGMIKNNCDIVPTQIQLVIHYRGAINGADQMTFGGQDGNNLNFSISMVTVYDTKNIESYVNRSALWTLDHELVFHQLGYTSFHDYLGGNAVNIKKIRESQRSLNFDKQFQLGGVNAVCYQPTSETLSEEEAINECKQKSGWHDLIGNGCGKDGIRDCEEDDPNYYNEVFCYRGCAQSDNFYRPLKYSAFLQGDDKTKDYSMYNFTIGEQKMRRVCNGIKEYTGQVKGICHDLCLEGCSGRCMSGVCI